MPRAKGQVSRLSERAKENVRSHIRAVELIQRLQIYALREKVKLNDGKGGMVEKVLVLDSTEIKAIEILLRKSLPDLQAVELSGENGGPVRILKLTPLDADA